MARFTPRTTEREMRSAWWDIKELLFVHSVSTRTETNMAPPNARAIRTKKNNS